MVVLNLILSCLLLAGACTKDDTTTETPTAATKYTDVAYATTSNAQKLDIYLPAGEGPFPVVVFIHGGAFLMGNKEMETSNAAVLVSKGYAAVSINYRLSGEAKFPAQIQDCKAAIRFLRANAVKYKLNSDKIASWGASAGGNLSALLGTSDGVSELEGPELGNSSMSSKVLVSVDWFGPINFSTMDAEASTLGFTITTNSATSPESKLMGAAIPTIPEQVAKANPATYISSDDAAFFIQVGDADRNIPYTQSKNLYEALLPVLGESNVSFELISGAGHGGTQFTTSSNMDKVVAFLDAFMK